MFFYINSSFGVIFFTDLATSAVIRAENNEIAENVAKPSKGSIVKLQFLIPQTDSNRTNIGLMRYDAIIVPNNAPAMQAGQKPIIICAINCLVV